MEAPLYDNIKENKKGQLSWIPEIAAVTVVAAVLK